MVEESVGKMKIFHNAMAENQQKEKKKNIEYLNVQKKLVKY